MTTPSKPYVPKDHPATPAVVISEEALTELPPKDDRARIAQTLPGQRSSPASAPLAASLSSGSFAPATAATAQSALDDTYPPIKKRGSKLPLLLAGAALLAAGGIALSKLGGSSTPTPADGQAVGKPGAFVAPPAEPASPSEPPPPAQQPQAEAKGPAPSEPVASAATTAEPPPPPIKKTSRPAKKLSAPVSARRPAAREPKPETKAASAPEPAPASKPAKGVIVRETPF